VIFISKRIMSFCWLLCLCMVWACWLWKWHDKRNMVNYTKPTKEQRYNLKNNMKTRCYNTNYHKVRPDYKDCTICDEWLDDKKSFYEWVDHNFYEIEGEPTVELDKDILVPGNKVYSPDTCIFVPKRINDLFVHIHGKKKNGLPTGVSYSEKTGKYQATVRESCKDDEDGKKKTARLGFFDTAEEAYEVYKAHKMAEIIYIADSYKDVIPDKLYQAMINWKFDEI
jgi:hypothetical protein